MTRKPLILGNWLVVSLLSGNLLLHNLQRFAPVSLFEELRTLWGTNYTAMGNLFAAHLITYGLCQIPMGLLADRVDNRRLMIIGTALSLASSVLFALSPSLAVAMLARVGQGLSSSFLYVPSVRYVVATFSKQSRASAMGWLEFGVGLGTVMASALLPFAMELSGLTSALLIPSAIAALLLLGITLGLKSTRSTGYSLNQAGTIFKSRSFWSLMLFNFLGLLALYAMSGWLPTYLRRDFQYSAAAAGGVASLSSVGLMVFSPIAGIASDRLGNRKKVLLAGTILSIICLSMMVFSHDIGAILIFSTLTGVSSALTTPIAMIFAGELFSAAGAGLAVALTATTGQIASSLSGPLFGYMLDSTGSFFMVWGLAWIFSTVRILCLLPIVERRETCA